MDIILTLSYNIK